MTNHRSCSVRARRGKSVAGVTLIEAMVVVTVSSLLLGTVISLAITFKRADRNIRVAALHRARLLDLNEQLRADIRQGMAVSRSAEDVLVVTSAGRDEITYRLGPDGCQRSSGMPGDANPRSDMFAIGRAESWTLEQEATGRRPLYMVTLNRPEAEGSTEPRRMPLLVYAALGADLPPATRAASAD